MPCFFLELKNLINANFHLEIKILITGNYDSNYNRNNIIRHGLKTLGITIIEKPFSKKRITPTEKKSIRELDKEVDFIYMPSFTHVNVPSVKRVTTKPLIFDPLISRYLTKVFDYKSVWKYSPRAYKNYLKDKISMGKANLVFADTLAHKQYFTDKLGIDSKKIHVLPVGVNEEVFYPMKRKNSTFEKFIVGFYGSYIPLHGIDVIIKTANLLKEDKDIHFVLLGDGVGYPSMKKLATSQHLHNLSLNGWVDYNNLNAEINKFDLCLGIFGSSLKADVVVPNKIYHYCACRKPVITKDTKAIREIFSDGTDILLSNPSPEGLARKIKLLKGSPSLSEEIAKAGYQNITQNYNSKAIAKLFIKALSWV